MLVDTFLGDEGWSFFLGGGMVFLIGSVWSQRWVYFIGVGTITKMEGWHLYLM